MRFSVSGRRLLQAAVVLVAALALGGAGDDNARFSDLGHRMMCVCGCNQILLECNHVGCQYSERMRGELMASLDRGDNDDLALQSFVQKYGTTVLAAPTTKGFNRVAWIIPYLVLLLGLAATMAIVRVWRGRQTSPAIVTRPGDAALDSYRRQAQQETEL
jgi:cytochrome c-type biogenesis protein CcmH